MVQVSAEQLDDVDVAILRFEQQWWCCPGAKDVQIRVQFGLTTVRYYQRLNRLIDLPAAMATAPVLCARLRRIRDRRREVVRP